MKIYTHQATQSTPYIYFDPATGRLDIAGRSIPENSVAFYRPLFDALDDYGKNPGKGIRATIQLEYYNSSSSVCILNLLKKLEALKDKVSDIMIEWHYEEEDEDTLAAGHNFQAIITLPIRLVKIAEK
jgi:hypothetical protein